MIDAALFRRCLIQIHYEIKNTIYDRPDAVCRFTRETSLIGITITDKTGAEKIEKSNSIQNEIRVK